MPRQPTKDRGLSDNRMQELDTYETTRKLPKKSINEVPSVMEKTDEEVELDRLVFGNGAEYMERLHEPMDLDHHIEKDDGVLQDLEDEDGTNAEEIDDADLFFFDARPSAADEAALVRREGSASSDPDGDAPAWEDSDDDRLAVSMAGNPRLRKLRVTAAEDVVSGKEYTRRLRRQYLRLHPAPEWAQQPEQQQQQRRRRRLAKKQRRRRSSVAASASSSSDGSDDTDVDVDMDGDADGSSLAALPLARLLQDAASLAAPPPAAASSSALAAGPPRRAALRPDVLDIQRTRDIPGGAAPSAITALGFHPRLPVLLSAAGPAATLRLHAVDARAHPVPNPLLTAVHVRNVGIVSAAFLLPSQPHSHTSSPLASSSSSSSSSSASSRIVFSGRRRYFHTWDLESGAIQKVTRAVYGGGGGGSSSSSQQQNQNHNQPRDEQRSMERLKPSPCGRYIGVVGSARGGGGGVVNVLDAATAQWVAAARVEGGGGGGSGKGGVADFAWWAGGEGLTIAGRAGEVSEWSLARRALVCRWEDEGAVGTTVVALGGGGGGGGGKKRAAAAAGAAQRTPSIGADRWVAVGSSSGVVNVYDRRAWALAPPPPPPPSSSSSSSSAAGLPPPRPQPARRLAQLTTPVTSLVFSGDGQLLALASRWKRDALRLAHLPSCTVYRNWPTGATPLGRVTAVAFGSGGGTGGREEEGEGARGSAATLAVANEAGKIRLWEIRS